MERKLTGEQRRQKANATMTTQLTTKLTTEKHRLKGKAALSKRQSTSGDVGVDLIKESNTPKPIPERYELLQFNNLYHTLHTISFGRSNEYVSKLQES